VAGPSGQQSTDPLRDVARQIQGWRGRRTRPQSGSIVGARVSRIARADIPMEYGNQVSAISEARKFASATRDVQLQVGETRVLRRCYPTRSKK